MKNYQKILVTLAFGVFLSGTVSAQSGGIFEIKKSVISNGGGKSDGGGFSLTGTVGQAVAGTNSLGGTFSLLSGFWASNQASAPDRF